MIEKNVFLCVFVCVCVCVCVVHRKKEDERERDSSSQGGKALLRFFFFTDILAGFTFNNRVLRFPAIVFVEHDVSTRNLGLLRVYVQAF